MDALKERAKFLDSLRGVGGVIGRDVEVIANRVGAAGDAFEEIGVVRGLADAGIISAGGLLQHAREPEVAAAHERAAKQGRRR